MKHNVISSKKLIKNFVYLVVSALVLISATIAWFAKGEQVDVDKISAAMRANQFDISYFRADVSEEEFIYDADLNIADKQSLSWKQAVSIDIDALYPGAFNAFKMVIIVNEDGTPYLRFNNISTDFENSKAIYDSVFLNAIAVGNDGNIIRAVSGSFSSFYDERLDSMSPLEIGEVKSGDTITVYFDIGMPGEDVAGTHDELRLTGAQISIGSVTVI